MLMLFMFVTPWKFNSSPLKIYHPKRNGSSSNHHFSGVMLNFGGVFRLLCLSLFRVFSSSPSEYVPFWGVRNIGFRLFALYHYLPFKLQTSLNGFFWVELQDPSKKLVLLEPRKKTWLVGLYRGVILPSYMGILINHYKDPY